MAYLRDDDEDYSSEDEDDLSSGDEMLQEELVARGGKEGGRPPIYNTERMHEILEEIGWTEQQPWAETQAITLDDEEIGKVPEGKVDDDIVRELAFYSQALEATKEAIRRFKEAGTPWLRPVDYYAEMVKSDAHMNRVKQQLVQEQKSISEAEERRKVREAKKYSKQVQAEKNKERTKQKKKSIEDVDRWRKQRKQNGAPGEDFDPDRPVAPRGGKPGGKPASAGRRFQPREQSKKREAHDKKYGFGGKKSGRKQNDAKSTSDFSGYKPPIKGGGVKKGGPGGKFGGKGGAKGKAPRPGKSKRMAGGGGGGRGGRK